MAIMASAIFHSIIQTHAQHKDNINIKGEERIMLFRGGFNKDNKNDNDAISLPNRKMKY